MSKKSPPTQSEVEDIEKSLARKKRSAKAGEKEILAEYQHMFKTLREMIRIFEDKVLSDKTERTTYALNNLYSQMREVIADIRTMTDANEQVNLLVSEVVTPLTQQMQQVLTSGFYQVREMVNATTTGEQKRFATRKAEEIFRDLARGLDDAQGQAHDAMMRTLVGADDEKPKKRRRR